MKRLILLILSLIFVTEGAWAQNEPFIIENGPYLQAVGNNQATIVWTTNRDGVAWVEVAPDDGSHFYSTERKQYFHTVFGSKNIGRVHLVTIDSLLPSTTYRYRIFTKEVKGQTPSFVEYGRVASTAVYQKEPLYFTTLNSQKNRASFVMVNDIHNNNQLFTSLMGNEKLADLDFVVLNGDMMTHLNYEKDIFNGFMTTAVELFAKEKPVFFVRGNHETRGLYANRFIDYFPTNNSKMYYTFKQGPAFFVVLDPGEDKPDSDIEYNGLADFDKYRREEAAWLKEVVESREFKEAAVRIVLIHIPPMGGKWHGNMELNRLFMPILNDANISLMLCAHEHAYRYMKKGQDGANFPMIVNSNLNSMFVGIENDKIKVRIKDEKGAMVKEFMVD